MTADGLRGLLTAHLRDAHGVRLSRAEDARTTLTELAALDPCALRPPAAGDLGRDASGYRVWRAPLSSAADAVMDIRVSECCGGSAKGSMGAVVCRACYAEIDALIGGEPNPPFISTRDGRVTGLHAIGWSRSRAAAKTAYYRCGPCSDGGGQTLHPAGYACAGPDAMTARFA